MWQGREGKKGRGVDEKDIGGKSDAEYKLLVDEALEAVEPKSRPAVKKILDAAQTRARYRQMVERGDPPRTIQEAFIGGIYHLQKGELSPGAYLIAVGNELKRHEGYKEASKGMYHDRVLTGQEAEALHGRVHEKTRKRMRDTAENLEGLARAAVWVLIAAGILLMLFSAESFVGFTGAVIGVSEAVRPATFFLGFIFFVVGLLMKKR
jgi:hypothetical protein